MATANDDTSNAEDISTCNCDPGTARRLHAHGDVNTSEASIVVNELPGGKSLSVGCDLSEVSGGGPQRPCFQLPCDAEVMETSVRVDLAAENSGSPVTKRGGVVRRLVKQQRTHC